MGMIEKFIEALETLGDGRYHYYDGRLNGIGCSEYTRLALLRAGVIRNGESFHAASGIVGPLSDESRFRQIQWDPGNLQRGDILWSHGHHVTTWDGKEGVYEAAPEATHGICDNGKTGVGHWSRHGYFNCGTGKKSWTCIFRIIEEDDIRKTAKEVVTMDKEYNIEALISCLPEIKKGSKCNTVKALQKILQKYGWYADEIDGQAGPNTEKGIKFLQTALGVEPDGIFGANCWKKLLTEQ